jgi:ATP-dependent DNA helicase DinG
VSEVTELLKPGGLLAELIDGYESRPGQVDMAEAVATAIAEQQHAIIEAPTGIGKSFAYLIPAAMHALRNRAKVVISTGTIALQEQLINKDLPLIQRLFVGLKAVLVKGRQNYISLRRLEYAASGQKALFENREQAQTLKEILDWSAETKTGDKTDLGYEPEAAVWNTVRSDRGNCRGRRCPKYEECFFYKAREELIDADILVVNHHLYFADLALRDDHAAILPPHDIVIFDEAHSLEDVATDHLGLSLSAGQVRFFCEGLRGKGESGLLNDPRWESAHPALQQVRQTNEDFWMDVGRRFGDRREDTMRVPEPDFFENDLSPALETLAKALGECQGRAGDDDSALEFRAQAEKALGMAGGLRQIISQSFDNYVYYASVPQGRGSPSLSAHPLSVGGQLNELLFSQMKTVILTSATLAADDSERFVFLRKRLGIEGGLSRRLDTPFDFKRQARLLVNASPLDPNSEPYERALAQWLGEFLEDAEGGTFVLFTSYRQLQAVHDRVRPRLDRANRFVLRHGDGMGRSQMLDLFKSVGNAVLFGTASFWEGVDVRGDALKNVVITKLPFEVPNHPLTEARHQAITAAGGNPFMERSVPEAILKLKQGVGRLIRTATDTGTLVLCDPRIKTKAYGRYFLRALPEMHTEEFTLASYL